MKLIAGLGNPGKEYENTRHNSGYMALARLAEDVHAGTPSKKFSSLCTLVNIDGEKVLLLEPLTYMNLSGDAVRAAADYYKIDVKDVLILHDDMDLPTGSVRIRPNGSAGGQKGMKHIITCFGTDAIARIRIGVGHSQPGNHDIVPDWVLSPVSKAEREVFEKAIETAAKAARAWVSEPLDKVMNQYNLKVKKETEKREA